MNTVLLKKSVTSLKMPSETQERIIQKCRAHLEQNLNNKSYSRPRRVAEFACTFIIALALALCIFPLPTQNSNGQFKFHLAGLTVSAYAAEVSNGYMEWNIQMLEKFDSINITVSDGYLSKIPCWEAQQGNIKMVVQFVCFTIYCRYGHYADV